MWHAISMVPACLLTSDTALCCTCLCASMSVSTASSWKTTKEGKSFHRAAPLMMSYTFLSIPVLSSTEPAMASFCVLVTLEELAYTTSMTFATMKD